MKRWLLLAVAAFATVGFAALGVWQLERRAWKLGLIERVERRVHATPVGAPGPAEWPAITRENAEYRRVTVTGRFMEDRQTLVRAVTDLGEGYWLLAPLQTDRGFVVLVNRGFVPHGWRPSAAAQSALGAVKQSVTITGLLRISEPHGAFLRSNAPAENRWYSRDVDAISHAQHLTGTAPYFIDAEADSRGTGPESSRPPVAGLTVIHFRNSHLQYAFTWFALALMAVWLGVRVARNR